MKLKQILMTAVLAVASMAAANANNTFNDGDVLFGITNSNSSYSYSYNIDLGNISDLISLSYGATKTWTLSSTDLGAILGTTTAWNNNSSVKWGVAAETTASLYATAAMSVSNPSTNADSVSNAQTTLGNIINQYKLGVATDNQGGSENIVSTVEVAKGAAGSISWYQNTSANNLSSLDYSLLAKESATSGTAALALFAYDATNGSATKIGTFSLTDSGVLTYTSLEAVPEPSTYAMLGIGGLAMLRVLRRRRTA